METKDVNLDTAIFVAELVIDIFEKEFPEDKRPRNAIESARKYLSHKDATAYDAVRVAARAAYVAAYDGAYDETRVAAYAAAYAARAAARVAAYDETRAAAYAARVARAADEAYVATYTKIINYGLSLLKLKSKT